MIEPEVPAELVLSRERVDVDRRIIAAYRQFGLKLFAEVAGRDAGKNVFLSPHSVATVLSMVYLGASGKTRQELAVALELEEIDAKTISRANTELGKRLRALDAGVEVILANSIWVRDGLELKSEFLNQVRESFAAEIQWLDFSAPAAPQIINQWAATNTKGKIPSVVERVDPLTVMVPMNAVYFIGKWAKPFDPVETKEQSFYLPDGTTKSVPMMAQGGFYWYCRQEGFQAVSLPYGSGRISFSLFLPEERVGLSGFIQNLNQTNWDQWKFQPNPGRVVFPKFKFEYSTCLDKSLNTLGVEAAFNPSKASFDGIRPGSDVFINEIKQKAVIEVNELGTEAAAVTGLRLWAGPFELVANRPFFFAIRDNAADAVLFMGLVNDPTF